uniref:Tumor protein D52 n=1 Tax=Pectinophora gossypiella TaxID=13191 RepID=A0A1E1W3N5_PECGO
MSTVPTAEEAMPATGAAGDAHVVDELAGLTPEQAEQLRAEWSRELARVEDEIATLRTVLQSKIRQSSELKRKLGITVWKEITDDVNQGLKNVKESQVYQKTESVIKTTAEKTTSILGGITAGVTSKLGQMRNSESFRSIEERVGSAYENVKQGKVASRSNSTQSFDEALRDASRAASGATSPSIPEHKPLP